jgi:hypothetical protein
MAVGVFWWGFLAIGISILTLRTKVHIGLCVQSTHYYMSKLYNSFLMLFLGVSTGYFIVLICSYYFAIL